MYLKINRLKKEALSLCSYLEIGGRMEERERI
jgi:hypothetical protein